jgi:hypothetical protein
MMSEYICCGVKPLTIGTHRRYILIADIRIYRLMILFIRKCLVINWQIIVHAEEISRINVRIDIAWIS